MNFFKSLLLSLALLCGIFTASADEKVTFEANVPMIVSADEAFRAEFSLNAKPDSDSFTPPSFEGFDVLAGPAVSQGSSMQIINGNVTKSISYTITYVLMAQRTGEITIGAAQIGVDGKSYSTRPTPVEVRESSSQQPQGGGGTVTQSGGEKREEENSSLESRAGNQIGKDDLMLRLVLSQSEVYKGEPIRAALKLYSRVNVVGSEGAKMPTFNGFWSQQLESEQGPFRESMGGKVYDAYTLAEYLLYPQQSGRLTVSPAEMTVIVQVFVQSNRGFDPFFGGGHEVYNLRRKLLTPTVTVNVLDLPKPAPASFTGAVGKYTMDAHISSESLAANSAASITVKIAGSGNINLLQAPALTLPASFELYDTKSSESIRNTASGSSGYRTFEYPFIARAEGHYTLPAVEFSYFNPDAKQYVTLSSKAFEVDIAPDPKGGSATPAVLIGGSTKEEIKLLGNDIRYIKLGAPMLRSHVAPLVLSPLWFCLLALLVAAAVLTYTVVRKRMRDSHNTALVRGRRANKVAVQRFRAAERFMRDGNRRAFYEEMLRALWGYMSDRFNIPVADLTKESIREELMRRHAGEALAREVTEIISRCEEAQYSPADTVSMEEVYADGIDIISKVESAIKR